MNKARKLHISSILNYLNSEGDDKYRLVFSSDYEGTLDYDFMCIIPECIQPKRIDYIQNDDGGEFIFVDIDGKTFDNKVICILWYFEVIEDEIGMYISAKGAVNGY